MDYGQLINMFLALVIVLALMGLLSLLLKHLNQGKGLNRGKQRRLKIIEILPLDPKHKAVLLQRDDQQHLVILSSNGDTVIETGIKLSDDDNGAQKEDAKPFD